MTNLNVDEKGRMAMPVKYRERLQTSCGGNMVVTIDPTNPTSPGQVPCLLLYPLPEWELIQAQIDALSSFDPASRKVQHLLVGHADDVVMDKSGRLLVSAGLRASAGIDKKVVLIGQGKKFELWDDVVWSKQRESWLEEAVVDHELPADLSSLSL